MPQLHLYVPDAVAEELRLRAAARGESLSQYLRSILQREIKGGWPEGFFEVVIGGWKGEPPARVFEGDLEHREDL